jgi:hypothetical protein
MPALAYGGYDPFGHGYWQSASVGFTWIETLPWGYYTAHGGRWVYFDDANRWGWVPGKQALTREFARALEPFGTRTRGSNDRAAQERLDDLAWRAAGDDDGRVVASSAGSKRRLDPEGRESLWHSAASEFKKANRGGYVPRTTSSGQGSSQSAASAPRSSSNSSSNSAARSSSSFRSSSACSSRPSISSKAFGRPQTP